MHEAQMHSQNCFVTLTYDDEHLCGPSLNYRDFQLFMKRVRKACVDRVRFFMCGEYGDMNFRPHFHACLFGFRPGDLSPLGRGASGKSLFRSAFLEGVWPLGFSSVGDLTFQSAAYVARYVMQKRTGPAAQAAYRRVDLSTGEVVDVEPEFCSMSLKPGIGARWYEKYHAEVFPHDRVIVAGKEAKPPKYYLTLLERQDPVARERVRVVRLEAGLAAAAEQTAARLAVREEVAIARCSSLRRHL